jgi:serralysin
MSGTGNSTRSISASGDQVVDGLLRGIAWNDATLYYSFPTGATEYGYGGEPATFGTISAMQQTAANRALNIDGLAGDNAAQDGFSLEGFTNLNVEYSTNANAHIRLAESDDPSTAWAYYPTTAAPGGDVWFGTSYNYRSPEAGNYSWLTMLHELGHSLGLKHGQETNIYGALPANLDAMEYSVMTYRSYVGGSITGGYTNETWGYAQTYMMADIAALQYMYGADYVTNSGNTVYSWNPSSGDTLVNGEVGVDAGGNRIFATVWDGGGIDTYDLSAYSSDLSLDLRPGESSSFSPVQIANLGAGNYASGNIYNALLYQGNLASLIENAIGGTGNDTILGNQADNSLSGGAGNDTLTGAAGDDVLAGQSGNDILNGDDGADELYGSSGNDTLNGGNNDDLLNGGTGADALDGGAGVDQASYKFSAAGVVVSLLAGTASGGSAAGDTLINIEDLKGSNFNDTLTGDGGVNRLYGLGGADTLNGGANNDWLYGDNGDDTLNGGDGDDRLTGGAGADVLNGGAGTDQVSYTPSASGVTVNLATGTGSGGDAAGDSFISVENIVGSAFGDTLTGDAQNNRFYSLGGNDVIDGGGGDDRIKGGAGDDTLGGGTGNDWFSGGAGADAFDGANGLDMVTYEGSALGVNVNLGTGTASGGDAAGDSFSAIENLGGSNFADTLTGDGAANRLYGFAGNDTLNGGGGQDRMLGGAGNDTMNGGTGNDWMSGGAGADAFDGGAGADMVAYEKSATGVTINLATGTASGGEAAGDSFVSIENVVGSAFADTLDGDGASNRLIGRDGDDVLNGGGGGDKLLGGEGADTLSGGGGNDYMVGGGGADAFDGGTGEDQVSYQDSTSAIMVDLGAGTAGGDAAGDTFVNVENIYGTGQADTLTGDGQDNRLWGANGDDVLNGGGGLDRLYGGAGADTINGGAGNDWFVGGSGADTFEFDPNWGRDVVSDYEDGIDLIDLSATTLIFADLTITQTGADTLISEAGGNTIKLDNTLITDITETDFIF